MIGLVIGTDLGGKLGRAGNGVGWLWEEVRGVQCGDRIGPIQGVALPPVDEEPWGGPERDIRLISEAKEAVIVFNLLIHTGWYEGVGLIKLIHTGGGGQVQATHEYEKTHS